MAKPGMEPEPIGISATDIRITISVLLCAASAYALKQAGILFTYGGMRLEIIQTMTSCIACLLCCQDNTKASVAAGKNRLVITFIGGIVGMAVAFLDNMIGSVPILVCMVGAGVLATLFLCKVAKVPYINARIGGVTFVLVACTLSGTARMWYALFRFVSTLYGVMVVTVVTWLYHKCGIPDPSGRG